MDNTMVVYQLTILYILFVYLYLNHLCHCPQLLLVSLKFEMMHFSGVIASKYSSTFSINSGSTHSVNWVCFEPVCVSCFFCLILGALCIASALHIFLQCVLSIPYFYLQVILSITSSFKFHVPSCGPFNDVISSAFRLSFLEYVFCFNRFYCTSTPFWPSITNRYDVGYFGKWANDRLFFTVCSCPNLFKCPSSGYMLLP